MTKSDMSRRVFLTLPDSFYEDLEFWAEEQGRPVANLAAFLLELAIREAKDSGKFPERKTDSKEVKKK